MQTLVDLGRILFSLYFLFSGVHHFANLNSLAEYAAAKKVPAPKAAVGVSGAMLLLGGASFLFGYEVAAGSVLLALFLLPAALFVHAFWAEEDARSQADQMAHFTKNIALAAAALALAGAWS